MGQEVNGASLGMETGLASSPETPDHHWSTAIPLFNRHPTPFPGVKRPDRDADHSHSPSTTAEVKNN